MSVQCRHIMWPSAKNCQTDPDFQLLTKNWHALSWKKFTLILLSHAILFASRKSVTDGWANPVMRRIRTATQDTANKISDTAD